MLGHLLVAVAVVVMVNLGFWQLRRLDERQDRNDLVASRMAIPAVSIGALVDAGDDPDPLRFRAVLAAGRFDGEASAAVRTTQDGVTGGWVFDTMTLADTGERVWVLRGFAGLDRAGEVGRPEPPAGEVEVQGIAVPVDRLARTARSTLEGIDAGGALPVVVQAAAADDPLVPVPVPDLGDGPHLAYAVQWFLFAGVAVTGYPILLRRRAAERDG